jgi:signal peptidase I
MEEKLFWISLASGAWALVLRAFLKKPERLKSFALTSLLHAAWWAIVGLMAAWLFASYKERMDLLPRLLVGLGTLGFALGLAWRRFKDRTEKGAAEVVYDDLEWADTGFSSILLAAFIMYVFVQAFKIPSGSMEKTLLIGDHLFVNKLIYGVRVPYTQKRLLRLREVRRGDVVVFKFPTANERSVHYGKDFIKRAIGLPGDVVEIKDKKVYVNGSLLPEPYVNFADEFVIPPLNDAPPPAGEMQAEWQSGHVTDSHRDNFGPITVPAGHYLVMGDNRDRSYDARFWGPLPEKDLKGKAWFVYWPFNRAKIIR